jgi:replication-associated recombination protein RarA
VTSRLLFHSRTASALDAITPDTAASYIFHGPKGSGKRMAALDLTQRLNCEQGGGDQCHRCQQIARGNYADFIVVEPEDKTIVTIEQIRRLTAELSLSPYRAGGIRLVLIDQAETLGSEAQNALLKSLEEPPPKTRFVLLTTSLDALLITVRSRLAAIYFAPIAQSNLATWLELNYQLKPVTAEQLAGEAAGTIGMAVRLATDSAYAATQAELTNQATGLVDGTLYDRLLLARRLTEAKTPPQVILDRLQRRLATDVLSGAQREVGERRFKAVASARRLAEGGVMPRVIFDRLAVEL